MLHFLLTKSVLHSLQSCNCSPECLTDEESSEIMQAQQCLFLASHKSMSSSWLLLLLLLSDTSAVICSKAQWKMAHSVAFSKMK